MGSTLNASALLLLHLMSSFVFNYAADCLSDRWRNRASKKEVVRMTDVTMKDVLRRAAKALLGSLGGVVPLAIGAASSRVQH
ncbi:hypothetical protein [Yinghuangia soli]|uniref:Uncharacterized protein n=1 Tax=Yinghuangia soli TaxID=2908204 RepID=A0AA41U5K9_9ACTN|nr:hypothetical protein [Yinghuangia soli]MCF2534060.1 hypothetical protein [Yinghuangia soli]